MRCKRRALNVVLGSLRRGGVESGLSLSRTAIELGARGPMRGAGDKAVKSAGRQFYGSFIATYNSHAKDIGAARAGTGAGSSSPLVGPSMSGLCSVLSFQCILNVFLEVAGGLESQGGLGTHLDAVGLPFVEEFLRRN